MLNDYEIFAWALWLDGVTLEDDEYSVEEKILFTAFYVKISLNNDPKLEEIFEAYFNCYMNGFINKFNSWIGDNNSSFMPHPVEMNQKFMQLSRPQTSRMDQDFIEYNHIVDEILQISPPYQTESPYAPKYMAQENKPTEMGSNTPSSQINNPNNLHKIRIKPIADKFDLMPRNEFSRNSLSGYLGIMPEYKNSNSFDSLRDGLNSGKQIEVNKSNMKGIADLINSLQNIYNMDGDDAPSQPPAFKTDSLFRNTGNGNSQLSHKTDGIKGVSILDLKNMPSGLSNSSFGFLDPHSKN